MHYIIICIFGSCFNTSNGSTFSINVDILNQSVKMNAFNLFKGVAPLAMPRRWRIVLKKKQAEKIP
jgi:hypothetical protein